MRARRSHFACGRSARCSYGNRLTDLGVFDGERYWDVYVEYAKAGPDDIVMRVTLCNRNEDTDATATLHFLPNLWCRNTWSWGTDVADEGASVAPCAAMTFSLIACASADWGKVEPIRMGFMCVR